MQYLEAQKRVCRKLNISYDSIAYNGLFSLDDIKDALTAATRLAWDLKPWSFKEGHKKTTAVLGQEQYDYPSDIQPESIYRLTLAGVPYTKRTYADYKIEFTNDANNTLAIFCEYNRFIFINQNNIAGGEEIDIFGKAMSPALSGDTDPLPFNPDPNSDTMQYAGNDAIIMLAVADLTESKLRDANSANVMRKNAFNILEEVYQQMSGDRATEQSVSTPAYETPDYFKTTQL